MWLCNIFERVVQNFLVIKGGDKQFMIMEITV